MKIVQLDLSAMEDDNNDSFTSEAHCGIITTDILNDAQRFMEYYANGLYNNLKVDESTFCFTIFNGDCYQIVGLLGVNDKPIDFQKYNIENNSVRAFHKIEYIVADKRLFTESFLKHAMRIVLSSVVDKKDDIEEVLWLEGVNGLCAKVLDKFHKQEGYYYQTESDYFAKSILELLSNMTNRTNEVLGKIN